MTEEEEEDGFSPLNEVKPQVNAIQRDRAKESVCLLHLEPHMTFQPNEQLNIRMKNTWIIIRPS